MLRIITQSAEIEIELKRIRHRADDDEILGREATVQTN
jgi:hypothetical protein